MEEGLTESEVEQMRRFAALHRVAKGILAKWFWHLTTTFVVAFIGLSGFLVWRSAKSVHRFSAETKLLYNPRKVEKFDTMADKQLMSVIDRKSLKRKVGESVKMPLSEKQCLTLDMDVKQSKKPENIFTLSAQSGSWKGAVEKVNAYAQILIDEYVAYRTRDLEMQRESIELRRVNLQKQIAEIESEDTVTRSKVGVPTPVEMLTTVNALLSDQRRNLSLLEVQIATEEVRKRRLEEEVGTIGPAIAANAQAIRKKSAEIEALDAELVKLRESYTDLNPKVLGKLEERKLLLDAYATFLKSKGIVDVAVEDLERIEKSALELLEVITKLNVLAESKRSLEVEIKNNEARSLELTTAVTALERLRSKHVGLEQSINDIDSQLENLEYLVSSLNNDLQQIERAGGAGDDDPFRGRNFLIALGGAFVIMLVVMFWILSLEFVFGNVLNSSEMVAWADVVGLGSLPKPGILDENDEKDVLGVVALNFCNAELPKGVIFVCRMPGVESQQKFREVLDWSLAMAGHRPFALNIVKSLEFTPPEGCESLINTVYKDPHGWFPVENRYSLAPTELQMLQADIEELKRTHDEIFIMMPEGFRKGGNFFNQLLGVCDCVLILVGAGVTPRADLSYVRRHSNEVKRPMAGIVTGASARAVRKEMETGK